MNDDETINTHDSKTGAIVSTTPTPIEKATRAHHAKQLSSGEYNRELGDCICQFIAEGETLTKVSRRPGFPALSIISFWRHINPDFEAQLKRALKFRATILAEQALDEASEVEDKEDVPAATLKVKTLQHAAACADPDNYGNKTKVSGDANAPLSFIIDTGIRRPGDEGYNVDESTRLNLEETTESLPTTSEV